MNDNCPYYDKCLNASLRCHSYCIHSPYQSTRKAVKDHFYPTCSVMVSTHCVNSGNPDLCINCRMGEFGVPILYQHYTLTEVLQMAKGGYMCIGYPDKIEFVHTSLDRIVVDAAKMGAETAYILHDKDIAEPHYHFIFFWRRSVTVWEHPKCKHSECVNNCDGCRFFNFIRFMELHGLKAPKKGSHEIYDYSTAVIKDIDAALDYLLHN